MRAIVRNITITPIKNEDLHYMYLAKFEFSLNAQEFTLIDYINPIFNIINPFHVEKSARNTGDSKPNLISDIIQVFDVDIDEAKCIFKSAIKQLNAYISENNDLRSHFPTFVDLLIKMHKHGFIDQSEINLNFIQKNTGVERHIRYKTVRDAMNSLEHYIDFNETNEEYTFDGVKFECEEYEGLSLKHNNTEFFKNKNFVVELEAFGKKDRIRFFDSLRDVICALPLDGFFNPSEEIYY